MQAISDHWIILRTSGRHTLRLVDKLGAQGFHAWTPTMTQRRRGQPTDESEAMLPSFAFARANHLHALLSVRGSAKLPAFSIFHHFDRIPLIHDGELRGLRLEERRAKRMTAPRIKFRPGMRVRLTEGAYAGMEGRIVRERGKDLVVDLGIREVKISTFILGEENIINGAT